MTVVDAMANGYAFPRGFLGQIYRIRRKSLNIEDNYYRHGLWILQGHRPNRYAKFFATRYGNMLFGVRVLANTWNGVASELLGDPKVPPSVKDYVLILRRHIRSCLDNLEDAEQFLNHAKETMRW